MIPALNVLEPVARVAVATLFNGLWESALIALAIAAILRLLRNVNASTRYMAWIAGLIAAVILPLATTIPQISTTQSAPAVTYRAIQNVKPSAQRPSTARTRIANPVPRTPAVEAAAPAAGPSLRMPARFHLAVPALAASILFAVWVVLALAILVRLIISLLQLERLKRDALPLPIDYRDRMERWATAAKGGREVRLCVSDKIEVPVAVGLFDSMILIPAHLLESLSQGEVDQITLHELAHLRRADDWTNGLQRILQAILFFNPAVLYMAQQLDLEREVACDDWVLSNTKDVRPYAFCLTKMAEVTAWPHRALAAPGVFMTRKSLSIRVERLLRAGRDVRTTIAFFPAGAVVAALIVAFFILQSIAPSFAFTPIAPDRAHLKARLTETKHLENDIARLPESVRPAEAQAALAQSAATLKSLAAQPSLAPSHVGPIEIHAPAINVHLPARNVRVPAVRVHVPAINVHLPAMNFPTPDTRAIKAWSERYAKQMSRRFAKAYPPGAASAVAQHLKAGGFNCTGCDFSHQKLAGRVNFRNANLNGADFSNADLHGVDFSGASLNGVDFTHADLRDVNFQGAWMSGCDLTGADVTGANFAGAALSGCAIDASRLSPQQARQVLTACSGCDFSHANFHGMDLSNVRISGDDFTGADFRGANLSGALFSGADFTNARFGGARLDGTEFIGCDFTGVDLRDVNITHATFTGSQLSGAIMR